jgi:ABC-2 type transport system ATP-binding protein
MEKDIAIKVKDLSKDFRIPTRRKITLQSYFLNPFEKHDINEFQALRDLSFEVKSGEFFSIIGRNGAGKSTLLKIMAGIYHPDRGKVEVHGKLVPFLELGVGFHPELSAEENVFLNGIILGLTRVEVEKYLDEIFDFAELNDFRNASIKNFSSGMQVRLAFSIAIKVRSDILLLDEVLAVGDTSFQRKCYEYFDSIKGQKTIVYVSHDLNSVEKYSDRVLLLDENNRYSVGPADKIIHEYTDGLK